MNRQEIIKKMLDFEDNDSQKDTSTGFVSTTEQHTYYIGQFMQKYEEMRAREAYFTDYISNLMKEYIKLNDGEPIFLENKVYLVDFEGDPINVMGQKIYGFGCIDHEVMVFCVLNDFDDQADWFDRIPDRDESEGNVFDVFVTDVANSGHLAELYEIFVANAHIFEELGLPNIQF